MPRCAVLDVPHGKSHHGDIVVQGLPIALIEHKSSGKTGGVLCLSGGGVVISSEKLYTEGFLPTPILAVVAYSDHGSGLARVDAKPLAKDSRGGGWRLRPRGSSPHQPDRERFLNLVFPSNLMSFIAVGGNEPFDL